MSVLAIVLDDANREEMEGWATLIAESLDESLDFVRLVEDGGRLEFKESGERVRSSTVSPRDAGEEIERHLAESKPRLLVADVRGGRRGFGAKLAGGWFERAHCDTLCLRFPEDGGRGGGRVLVPTVGGPNAKGAIGLAVALATTVDGGRVEPLLVESDASEVSEDVGQARLDAVLARADVPLDAEVLHPQVRVDDRPEAAIHRAAEEGEYDLVLLGASGVGGVYRALFGSLPDRLLNSGERVTVGVFRRATPVSQRVREMMGRWLHLRVPQLDRKARVALFENLETNSRWSFDFMVLICLSTALAGLGLMLDSGAVVIGAMLVAPLMTPLLAAGLALVQGHLPLMRQCVRAILYGFFAALLIGLLLGLAGGFYGLTHQMKMRGSPDVPDMVVAFLSGVAASYCVARPQLSSALAGVAIAAALVPPIATTGIALAMVEPTIARGAALLFGTNVVFIILGAACNFFAAGIRARKREDGGTLWAKRTLLGLMAAAAVLAIPLGSVLLSKIPRGVEARVEHGVSTEVSAERRLRQAFAKTLQDLEGADAELREIDVRVTDSGWRVTATVRVQQGAREVLKTVLLDSANEQLDRDVELRLVLEEFEVVTGG